MKLTNLEDVIPDFYDWPGSADETFEEQFLKPAVLKMHAEATMVRFVGGSRGSIAGSFTNRTVQIYVGTRLVKSYKYGRP